MRFALPLVRPTIVELSEEEAFEFVVHSDKPPEGDWGNVHLHFIPWKAKTEVTDLHQIDIGIMPLDDNPFERGKCGMKLILYGGTGIPGVASPVGVNVEIIQHGVTGFLATTPEEWITSLKTLLHDAELRKSMGEAARRRVKEHYSVQSILPIWREVLEKTLALYPRDARKYRA
jgi:glycosyltransferase involved in cell wall biosynthesis